MGEVIKARRIEAADIKLTALDCPACGAPLNPKIDECSSCHVHYEIHSEIRDVKTSIVVPKEHIILPANGENQKMRTAMLIQLRSKSMILDNQQFSWKIYQDPQSYQYMQMGEALKRFHWTKGQDHYDRMGDFFKETILVKGNMLTVNPIDYADKIPWLCGLGQVFVLARYIPDKNSVFDPDFYYYDDLSYGKPPLLCYLAPVTYIGDGNGEERLTYSYLGYPGSKPDGYNISTRFGALRRNLSAQK
jgi:hypothetical protein